MKGNEIMDNKELCYMLDLGPDTVEDVDITRKDEKYVFNIVMKRQTYECPECHGCFTVGAEQNSNSALFFMTFLSNFVYFSIVIFRNV